MNNIKLAFERYLDLKSIQRRQSLLRWSLESSNKPTILNSTTLHARSHDNESWVINSVGNTEKSSIFQLSSFLHKDIRDIDSLRSHLKVWKRNFTSNHTRFFENNFDIIVNESLSEQKVLEQGEHQLKKIQRELLLFNNNKDEYTPDIIDRVRSLFHWLYQNKLYSLAYQLIIQGEVIDQLNLFFKYRDLSSIIYIIDNCGSPEDLLHFSQSIGTKSTPNILKRIKRLDIAPIVIKLQNFKSLLTKDTFEIEAFKIKLSELFTEKTNYPDGLKALAYNIIYQGIDTNKLASTQINELLDHISELDHDKKFFTVGLINYLYSNFKEKEFDINKRLNFFVEYINLHSNNEDFKNQLFFTLSNNRNKALAFKLWYDLHYKRQAILNQSLKYDEEYPELKEMHQMKLDILPKKFYDELSLSRDEHSDVLSLLLFTHSKYGRDYLKVKSFFSQKKELGYQISEIDNISYISALINSKDYQEISLQYEHIMTSVINSPKLMDDMMIVFARNRKWQEMEQLYISRFINNDDISINQYTALFISLSLRSGSIKFILQLWETFLKAGHQPTDHILCCIIISFIKTRAYREALQWFSAYSKYDIPLSARSYGLMVNILASTRDSNTVFQLLDTLYQQNTRNLKGKFMTSVLKQFAYIGDYKSIERILLEYYPKFNIKITDKDTIWILKSHYFSNRFSVILNQFWNSPDDKLDYDLTLLALETALKLNNPNQFRLIWERVFPLFLSTGELDTRAYTHYMAYWVRVYGYFGVQAKLTEITNVLKTEKLPIGLYNQMIFSSVRTHKPWLAFKILKLAIENNSIPSPKTYSLLLYANVSMPWIAEKNITQTINILDEVLQSKKSDRFGMIDEDINPIAFKMVIKSILKQGDIYEARRLFELYLETSTNNLLNNIHILNTELLLLGEEERWVEFDGCYRKYLEILERNVNEAKMLNESQNIEYNAGVDRADKFQSSYLNIVFDDEKIKQNNIKSKIPNWLKHAHYDIWQYRLKQLEISDSLGDVNSIFNSLIEKQILISNKNLNETALLLSTKPHLFDETIEFINQHILPWHIRTKSYERMRLRYGWGQMPLEGISKPLYHFIPEVYFKVMKNLNITLNEVMPENQKSEFLNNVNDSFEYTILKNLATIESNAASGALRASQFATRKRSYYRKLRRKNRLYNRWNMKYQMAWSQIEESQHYDEQAMALRDEMTKLGAQLSRLIDEDRPEFEIKKVRDERDDIKHQYLELKRQQRQQRRELIQQERMKETVGSEADSSESV